MAEIPGTRRMIQAVLAPECRRHVNTDPGVARDAKTLGASDRGQQNQSTVPPVVTSAPVCRSPVNPRSPALG